MDIKNIEFKAIVKQSADYENRLLKLNPDFKGEDHQVDTYFRVQKGRLKLREGNIENSLIQYNRENLAGSKLSSVLLYRFHPDLTLKTILSIHIPVWKVVDKIRRIYYIDNVKFHFDRVKELGEFVEVEAADKEGKFSVEVLKQQCDYYKKYLEITDEMMMSQSYSDMI